MNRFSILFIIGCLIFPGVCISYPLDGFEQTGIYRLQALQKAQKGEIRGPKRVAGARWEMEQVDIRLIDHPNLSIPDPDADFTKQIRSLLGKNGPEYSVAVLDLTELASLRYAQVNGTRTANPGSVGKLLVALGLLQALSDMYPDSIEKRQSILKSTMVTADTFIQYDSHKVPFWEPASPKITYRPIRFGDQASLWTFLDWMMSASSNAAAGMLQKELVLMTAFGQEYPQKRVDAPLFFEQTPKQELKHFFAKGIQDPVTLNGLNLDQLRQGSFFTWAGKRAVPGTTSIASPQELMRFLLKMEQGRLVDPFSSREIKRLLYMTGKRIRYASAPALYKSAVYFKSGSFYKCKPEPEFKCRKYKGNVLNRLASVAIVEDKTSQPHLHYMVTVMSNVLYENSAVAHQTLATRIHRMIQAHHKPPKNKLEKAPPQKQSDKS